MKTENRQALTHILNNVKLRRHVRKLRGMRKAPKYVSIVALFAMTTGCGAAMAPHNGLVIMGSPDAIRAYNDGQTGLVTTGKASPDQKTAYHVVREQEEREHTIRETSPGFLSNLFGDAK